MLKQLTFPILVSLYKLSTFIFIVLDKTKTLSLLFLASIIFAPVTVLMAKDNQQIIDTTTLTSDLEISLDTLETTPTPQQKKSQRIESSLIYNAINSNHLLKEKLDDLKSNDIFERYLETLDPGKFYFLKKDVDSFTKSRNQILNHIRLGELDNEFDIFTLFRKRVEERIKFTLSRLDEPFDFKLDEQFLLDREEAAWASNTASLNEIWRKRIKNDILIEEFSNESLTTKEIINKLKKRYINVARRVRQQKANDVFQSIMNAYTLSVEPHTAYLTPRDSENFDIHMRLSLQGIGAVLQQEDEYTIVRRIIPGGPAAKDGRLQADERIVGVGTKEDNIIDVIGWRLDDVVDRIRGEKGSKVSLKILPDKDDKISKPKTITLTRDKISLEERTAQYSIKTIESAQGLKKIGLIDIDSFYIDFTGRSAGNPNYRSTTRDVRNILNTLKKENIDGIIIDLRRNGGGGLPEAISLAGLFIKEGPVVQIQTFNNRVHIEKDPDPEIVYTGPLAVMIDEYSASASEIFAGAIKDYNRGILIGTPTFGKGTVQSVSDLNRGIKFIKNLGRINLTTAQFFRINGSSTQHKGVEPDIAWERNKHDEETGERSYENSIPWRKIQASDYEPFILDIPERVISKSYEKHKQRIKNHPDFVYEKKLNEFNQTQRDKKFVELNKSIRAKNRMELDDKLLTIVNQKRSAKSKTVYANFTEYEEATKEEEKQKRIENKPEFDDPFLIEGVHILADYMQFITDETDTLKHPTDSNSLSNNISKELN